MHAWKKQLAIMRTLKYRLTACGKNQYNMETYIYSEYSTGKWKAYIYIVGNMP
jgi:hypothetical protein